MLFLLEHGHFPGSRHVHSLRLDRKHVVRPHQKPKELIPDLICMDTLEAELTSRKPLYCFKKWGKQHTAPDIKGLWAALMKCSDAFSKKIRERKQMAEQRKRYNCKLKLYFLLFPVSVVEAVRFPVWTTLMVTLPSVALVAYLHLGNPQVLT